MEIRLSVRYHLRNRQVLRWVMDHPGRGTPYTIRELATVSHCSHSLIGHLLSGRQGDCDMEVAHGVASALGVAVLVLFLPPTSPDQNEPTTHQNDQPEEP